VRYATTVSYRINLVKNIMEPPKKLGLEPDDESLVWLRARISHRREMGARVSTIAADMGVLQVTLSKFLDNEDRKPLPQTWALYRRWYAKEMGAEVPISELQQKATKALDLFREGQEILEEVVSHIKRLPVSPDEKASIDAADLPMPEDAESQPQDPHRRADGE